MGYEIRAFVASRGMFKEFQTLSPYITVAELHQGFGLLLNDSYLLAALQITTHDAVAGFWYLSKQLLDFAIKLSHTAPIAYIEAEFFGGNGEQTAIVCQAGQIVLQRPDCDVILTGPIRNAPINSALRLLGVNAAGACDEFDATGLDQHRHMENWFAANTSFAAKDYQGVG